MLIKTEERFHEATRLALGISCRLAQEFCQENFIETYRLHWIADSSEVKKLEQVADKVPCSIFKFENGFGLIYSALAFEPFGFVFHESDEGYQTLLKKIKAEKIKTAEVGCLKWVYLGNEELSWLEEGLPQSAYLNANCIPTLCSEKLPAAWPFLSRHVFTGNETVVSYPALASTVNELSRLVGLFDRKESVTLRFSNEKDIMFSCKLESRIEPTREVISHILSEGLFQFSTTYAATKGRTLGYCSNNFDAELKDPAARRRYVFELTQAANSETTLSLYDYFLLNQVRDMRKQAPEAVAITAISDSLYQGFFGLNNFLSRCTDGEFGHLPTRVGFWFSLQSGKHYPDTMLSPGESKTVREEFTTLTSGRRVVADINTAQVYKTGQLLVQDVLENCSDEQAIQYLKHLRDTCGEDKLALPTVDLFSQDLVDLFVGAEAMYIDSLSCFDFG